MSVPLSWCPPCSLCQESRPIFAFNRAVLQRPHAPQILPMDINGWSISDASVVWRFMYSCCVLHHSDAARAPGLDEAWRKPHALLQLIQVQRGRVGCV